MPGIATLQNRSPAGRPTSRRASSSSTASRSTGPPGSCNEALADLVVVGSRRRGELHRPVARIHQPARPPPRRLPRRDRSLMGRVGREERDAYRSSRGPTVAAQTTAVRRAVLSPAEVGDGRRRRSARSPKACVLAGSWPTGSRSPAAAWCRTDGSNRGRIPRRGSVGTDGTVQCSELPPVRSR